MRLPLFAAACAAALAGACQAQPRQAASAGAPVDVGPANAPAQQPAFAGQTRAPQIKSDVALNVTTVARGLDHPWGLAFLPDGRMLVTERAGRLRVLGADGALSDPVQGLPKTDARGQGGLLDIALSPNFAADRLIYWTYAEPRQGGNGTAAARGKLSADASRVEDVQVIFHETPTLDSDKHFGGRLVFAPDGKLFITLGERSIIPGRMQAQNLDSHLGKIVRINADGTVPQDNPFVGKAGAKPEIWSIGHRNIQAAALDPATGELWEVEHGTRGGDELNHVMKGKDYGWPTVAYGIEYAGGPITGGITQKAGTQQPVYYWDPVIAPSGMIFYTGAMFPAWRNSIFIGGLKTKDLVRLTLAGGKVTGEERLLKDVGERIRDVRQGPDGALYVLTDEADGKVLRITPKG